MKKKILATFFALLAVILYVIKTITHTHEHTHYLNLNNHPYIYHKIHKD